MLAAVLCAVAALSWTAGPASAQGKLDRITIDWATYNPLSMLIRKKGLIEKEFARDGIAVRWVQSAGSNKALEFLNASSIDIGSAAGAAALLGRVGGKAGVIAPDVDVRATTAALVEPFSALDVVTRRALQSQLLSLQALRRPTVVIATHDVEEAALLADRVVVLRPGRIGADLVLTADRPRRPGAAVTEAAMRTIQEQLECAIT